MTVDRHRWILTSAREQMNLLARRTDWTCRRCGLEAACYGRQRPHGKMLDDAGRTCRTRIVAGVMAS